MLLYNDDNFIKSILPNNTIKDLLSSDSYPDKILAMKNILCKFQKKEDISIFFNRVIKIIETTNRQLKTLTNEFLKNYFLINKDEDKKLLIVNTMLKDLVDMRDITYKYIIDFSTIEIINNYLPIINRNMTYELAFKIYNFNLKIFSELNIQKDTNSIEYLNLCSLTNLEFNDILLQNINNISKLVPILRRLYYDKQDIKENILSELIKKDNLLVFYYTFRLMQIKIEKLMEQDKLSECTESIYKNKKSNLIHGTKNSNSNNSKSNICELLQKWYDTSFIHMTSCEIQYHILLLHKEILHLVNYENSKYLIFNLDPDYIKKLKIKLLFNRKDKISIEEIKRHIFIEIVELSLKESCIIFEDVFYKCNINNIIDLLIKSEHDEICFTEQMQYLIQKYLIFQKDAEAEMNFCNLKKFIHVCSLFMNNDEIIKTYVNLDWNILIDFYINLYKRRKITKMQVLDSLKNYKSIKTHAKSILEMIDRDINSIVHFKLNFNVSDTPIISTDLHKPYLCDILEESEIKISNLHFKTNEKKEQVECEIKQKDIFNLPDTRNNSTEDKNEYINFEDLNTPFYNLEFLSTKDKIFIDHKYLKGVVCIINNEIFLVIDILEKNTILKYQVNNTTHKKILSAENKIKLTELNLKLQQIEIQIFDSTWNIKFSNFIEPCKISLNEWTEKWKEIKKYKLIKNIDLSDVYVLDEEKFCFKKFNNKVYGKVFNNKILIKSDSDILNYF